MLLFNIEHGRIVSDEDLKRALAAQRPYQDWLARTQIRLEDLPTPWEIPTPDTDKLLDRQQAFGYTQDDLKLLLAPMAMLGDEGIDSIGGNSRLAVVLHRTRARHSQLHQSLRTGTHPPS